ncbi:hypothetical protein DB30_02458 [Enhygromyxa salina]|uniref:Putative zinc-finger domain-containing protein n=1 Tax=Enhygromyxa salina TaxID=215803 RepID=A0A0C2D3N9_9BACT|nr:hypothetical protein DB30_02458 [Enhygromyxa salina]
MHGHRPDISCREVSEFLLAYLDRELDEPSRAEFELHLKLCPPCVNYLEGYRDTIALVRACTRDDAEGAAAKSCEGQPNQRPKKAPPEGLIQAILSAKCRAAAGKSSE